ncbi:hypothetical protein [Mesorhizobium sp. YR577]|uniref:COG4223 family protein n=1 Tax=Mesorhizobium sp. YR577 TaxID=1884373 RepID=UPI0008EF6C58|nr:hypothetical protein [Mesorhizobium sp. YR577]SFT39968.1 Uncharacterized conserved protein [Mesorhizobium sp. YR577]
MVKTPKTRHSKTHREPVTIELEPGAVSRIKEAEAQAAAAQETSAAQAETPEAEATQSGGQNFTMVDTTAEAPASSALGPEQDQAEAKPVREGFDYDFSAQEPKPDEAGKSDVKEETSRPAQPEKPVYTQPEQRRSGFPPLAAGIVGGLIALAGAGALQYAGLLPSAGSDGSAVGSLQSEITQVRQEIASLKDNAGGPDVELTGRVDALTQSVNQAKTDLANLQQAAPATGGDDSAVQALDGRMKELETSIASLREQGSGQAAASDLTAIGERVAGVETLARTASEAVTASDGRLSAVEQKVTDLSGKVEAQAGQPKVALAIAATALKAALDRGAPFQAELETFAAISPDAPEVAGLRPFAEKGVPSTAEITGETEAAVKAMLAVAKPVDEQASFVSRLMSSVEALVSVRPVGPVEGTGVPETVARMEFALKSGELDKALAEYDTLPEAAKAAGSTFAEKLRARVEAQKLVDQAVAGAMKA